MAHMHGGANAHTLDFSANITPLGMHPAAREAVSFLALETEPLARYPEPDCAGLRELLAQFWSDENASGHEPLRAEHFVCGAGAVDLIFALVQCLSQKKAGNPTQSSTVVVVESAFTEYARAAELNGMTVRRLLLPETNGFSFSTTDLPRLEAVLDGADLLFLASPANPSGTVVDGDLLCQIAALCEKRAVQFVLDACFCQFSEKAERGVRALVSRHREFPRAVVLNAFTKFYGMAGLRLGYTLCFSADVARALQDCMRPWAVGAAALAAGTAVLRAELAERAEIAERAEKNAATQAEKMLRAPTQWERNTHALVSAERERLAGELKALGFSVAAGDANFILFRAAQNCGRLDRELLSQGISIRSCADFHGLDARWYRIAVRTPSENTRLLDALRSHRSSTQPPRSKAAAIMVQGTMSNAGKSLLVAALCRIFRQDGYRVAPFKSQNMALNSGVTADGLEMGRAQIMQAEAAGVLPDVRMNPILLKPTGDHVSQVIVNGEPTGTMDARTYFSHRKKLIPQILSAYESLAEENDIIIIEGAGSPAEINLKQDDIVNMGLAELVDAPVLLAGDIDRGGVFSSLYGTVALLEPHERRRIKGFVINKFRGDVSLLQDGLDQIRRLTGIPVLGVVPFIENLLIDDEDSLSSQLETQTKQDALLHIAVVRLPYISNFTDISAFSRLPFVQVSFFGNLEEYAACVTECGEPDMFILPGTKNTVHAMQWLVDSRISRLIFRKAKSGVPVAGICGGFQLLGMALHDADGNEDASAQSNMSALGLLPVETHFTAEKTRVQVSEKLPAMGGVFAPLSGCAVKGYEIHHGRTQFVPGTEDGISEQGRKRMPLVCVDGNVLGTYVHGFFDSEEICRAIITMLCERKDIPVPACESYESVREAEYNRLASVVRASLDMDAVRQIVFGKPL